MGYDLGVDLGTTFVAAAISRDGRVEMCTLGNQAVVAPAVVYFTKESKLIFGEAAERRVLSDPGRVERGFKRRLGDPAPVRLGGVPHQVTALMAEQLHDVLDAVTKVEGGPPDPTLRRSRPSSAALKPSFSSQRVTSATRGWVGRTTL